MPRESNPEPSVKQHLQATPSVWIVAVMSAEGWTKFQKLKVKCEWLVESECKINYDLLTPKDKIKKGYIYHFLVYVLDKVTFKRDYSN